MDVQNNWQFSLTGFNQIWFCSLIALIAVASIVISWLGYRNVSSLRITLFSMRTTAIVFAALIALQPHLEMQEFEKLKNKLVFVFDVSKSMTIKTGNTNKQRSQEVEQFLAENRTGIDHLQKEFDVEFLTFSDGTNKITENEIENGLQFNGLVTDIGGMLSYLKEHYDKYSTDAFLFFSDGGENADKKLTDETSKEILKESAGSLPAPMFAFSPGDPDTIKDVAVVNVKHNELAFARKTVDVKVELKVDGFEDANVPVTLKEGKNLISSKLIEIKPGKNKYTLNFEITPYKTGQFVYSVSTPVYDNEIAQSNNKVEFSLTVARDKIRVLQLCGRPSWDVRFFRKILTQFHNLDLISFYILRSENDVSEVPNSEMSLIPFPIEELFTETLNSFDMVIFQNFDYRPFNTATKGFERYFTNIKRYVMESGGAFLMIGGDLSFSQGDYNGTELEDILPVNLSVENNKVNDEYFKATLTPHGQRHPIGILDYSKSNNLDIWKELPPLHGCNKVTGLKQGAIPIVEHTLIKCGEESLPIISVADMGNGRSMAILTDSLWKWDFLSVGKGGSNRHYIRFWDNSFKWLIHDPDLNTVKIRADQTDYILGETIKVRSILMDASYNPVKDAQTVIKIINCSDEKEVFSGEVKTDSQGKCFVDFKPDVGGYYKAVVRLNNGSSIDEESYAIFRVHSPDNEFRDIRIREDILSLISTASCGEFYRLPLDEKLEDKIKLKKRTRFKPSDRKDYSLWDNWIVFTIISGILSTEWWLRRKTGLN